MIALYHGHKLGMLPPRKGNLLCARAPRASTLVTLMPVLPDAVDLALRSYIEPRDQGACGSCTGHSTTAFRELLWATAHGEHLADRLAPAYSYARTRIAEGSWPKDAGATIADEMAVLEAFGVCREASMPYDADPAEPVPEAADVEAQQYRIGEPAIVDLGNIDSARQVLAAGLPINLAIPVYASFGDVSADGTVPVPDPEHETLEGGHGVCIAGYDVPRRAWLIVNSWGRGWANGGLAWLPWAHPWWEAWTAAAC